MMFVVESRVPNPHPMSQTCSRMLPWSRLSYLSLRRPSRRPFGGGALLACSPGGAAGQASRGCDIEARRPYISMLRVGVMRGRVESNSSVEWWPREMEAWIKLAGLRHRRPWTNFPDRPPSGSDQLLMWYLRRYDKTRDVSSATDGFSSASSHFSLGVQ